MAENFNIPMNCNGNCVGSCSGTTLNISDGSLACNTACSGTCSQECSNLCVAICTTTCQNACISSCGNMCGDSCDTTCITACSGSSMKITKVNTYLDRASMRKVTALITALGDGLLIYPGLLGKFTIHRIIDEIIKDRLSVAMRSTNKNFYHIEEIQAVLYEALMKALPMENTLLNKEDILYLVYHDKDISKLIMDVQHWAWNNSDSPHTGVLKAEESDQE